MSKSMNANTGRPAGKPWTAEADAILQDLARMPRDLMPWSEAASRMGRTVNACRQRVSILQGRVTRPVERQPEGIRRTRAEMMAETRQEAPDPLSLPKHNSITAQLCGDPLPGRSALDRVKASAT